MIFCIFFAKKFVSSEKSCTFALANEKQTVATHKNGALVQSVRISACHAGGHEFESRTHRKKEAFRLPFLFSVAFCLIVIRLSITFCKYNLRHPNMHFKTILLKIRCI